MAIENGMDIKTLSGMIGHSSAATTLNIYSHITDTMRLQASVKIDRKIGGTNTGGLYQISENLWEGSFYPRLPDGTRKKFNVYAKTKAECEKKLAKMIAEKKAEIAKQKKAQKKG